MRPVSKYHRQSHHTYPSSTNPEAGHDPIASYDNPFMGDFVLMGALSATVPSTSAYSASFIGAPVGIGTSTPNAQLTVVGDISSTNNGVFGKNLTIGGDFNTKGNLYTGGLINSGNESVSGVLTVNNGIKATGSPSAVLNGNVGINVSSPPVALTVNGAISSSGNLFVGGNLTVAGNVSANITSIITQITSYVAQTSSNQFYIENQGNNTALKIVQRGNYPVIDSYVNSSPVFYVDGTATNGFVGIGTKTPNTNLTVLGSISALYGITSNTLTSQFIQLVHPAANDGLNPSIFIGENVNSSLSGFNLIYDEINNAYLISSVFGSSAPTTAFYINQSNNVGINTITPNSSLTVNGSISGNQSITIGLLNSSNTSNYSSVVGGCNNNASGSHSIIGNGGCNTASGNYAIIGGGFKNTASATYAVLGGGDTNCITNTSTGGTVGGGRKNCTTQPTATVAGGCGNTASGNSSTVAGGINNIASGDYSSINGGSGNTASGVYSFVAGGSANNTNSNCNTFILGSNLIASSPNYTYVNNISSQGIVFGKHYGDGSNLTNICSNGSPYTTGSSLSSVKPFIGSNNASSDYSIILGGTNNSATNNYSTIINSNSSTASGYLSLVSGGKNNKSSGDYSSVTNGYGNCATTNFSNIINGCGNKANNCYSYVGNGINNTANGYNSFVLGGTNNTASGYYSYILGGINNDTKGYANTLLLGSYLSANANNFTYVNNLSSQGAVISPTVITQNLLIVGDVNATGSVNGTARAAIVNGSVRNIIIGSGGSGYSPNTTVTIDAPTDTVGVNIQATAIPTIVNGVITNIIITNPGRGYIEQPNITISDNSNVTWYTPTISTNAWNSVAYGNGVYVAVAWDQSTYSYDGITWNNTINIKGNWNSITYGNGIFVAVGDSTKIAYSSDGYTWQTTTITSGYWQSVTYGNGKFVVVGSNGYFSSNAAYSTDGINWTTTTIANGTWQSVTYGNGKYVAVGYSSITAYSSNGITWNTASIAFGQWLSVTYGNGKYVAISESGPSHSAYSTDGVTWTTNNLPSGYWTSITFGNGKFVAVATLAGSVDGTSAYSTDGVTWYNLSIPVRYGYWSSVTYGNGKFVAVANRFSSQAAYLLDSFGVGSGATAFAMADIRPTAHPRSRGSYYSAFLFSDGRIYASGRSFFGSIPAGYNSDINFLQPIPIHITDGIGIGRAIEFWTPGHRMYVLDSLGGLWSSGKNYNGELGTGDTNDQLTLNRINATYFNNKPVVRFSCSRDHMLDGLVSCIAMTSDGSVYTWGYNTWGQLGFNNTTTKLSPTLVSSLGTDNKNVYMISDSYHTGTFVLKNNGQVYSCGYNVFGELGRGTGVPSNFYTFGAVQSAVSAPIGNIKDIHGYTGGSGYHGGTYFITNDGNVYGTGYNGRGALGLGDYNNRYYATRIANISNIVHFQTFVTPNDYAYCVAYDNSGRLWSWGINNYGQLGLGHFLTINIPTRVLAPKYLTTGILYSDVPNWYWNPNIIKRITLGVKGFVILTYDGRVFGCGHNYYGQLGQPNTLQTLSYLSYIKLLNDEATEIAFCGVNDNIHLQIVSKNGRVYVCGHNSYGQLGLNNINNYYYSPIQTYVF